MRSALLALALVGCATASAPADARPPGPPLDVQPTGGLGLFDDEAVQSQELVAQALRKRGHAVASVETLRRAWALAAEGRHPVTGQSCGRPLHHADARRRWGATLGVGDTISPQVWCEDDGGCEVSFSGSGLSLRAPIAREGAPLDALRAALPKLATPPEYEGGGGLGLLGSGGGSPVQQVDRLVVSVNPADARRAGDEAKDAFPALTPEQLSTCFGREDWIGVLVEFSARGALTRCEAQSAASRTEASCACGQLQRTTASPALAGQRWSVHLRLDRKDVVSPDGALIIDTYWNAWLDQYREPGEQHARYRPKVEDPSIEAWAPPPERLVQSCFANAFTAPGKLHSRWAVWFDAEGRATKVAEQKTYPPLAPEQRDCVVRALKTSQSPCPSRAGLWAMTDLNVSARPAAH